MNKVRVNFSTTKEVAEYLKKMDNYSAFITNLIEAEMVTLEELDAMDIDLELNKIQAHALIDRLFGGK